MSELDKITLPTVHGDEIELATRSKGYIWLESAEPASVNGATLEADGTALYLWDDGSIIMACYRLQPHVARRAATWADHSGAEVRGL